MCGTVFDTSKWSKHVFSHQTLPTSSKKGGVRCSKNFCILLPRRSSRGFLIADRRYPFPIPFQSAALYHLSILGCVPLSKTAGKGYFSERMRKGLYYRHPFSKALARRLYPQGSSMPVEATRSGSSPSRSALHRGALAQDPRGEVLARPADGGRVGLETETHRETPGGSGSWSRRSSMG